MVTRVNSYVPEIFFSLRRGYSLKKFLEDSYAGFIIAITSLPLMIALSMVLGFSPNHGLIACVIGNVIVGLFSSSRYAIASPTNMGTAVCYHVLQGYGVDGLVMTILIASGLLVIAGVFRFGSLMTYIPCSVVSGLTVGIGFMILTNQLDGLFSIAHSADQCCIRRFFYEISQIPFVDYYNILAVMIVMSYLIFMYIKHPKFPSYLLLIVVGILYSLVFPAHFKSISHGCPTMGDMSFKFFIPYELFSFDKILVFIPSAISIAFLACVENMVSCAMVTSVSGRKQNSNLDIICIGIANFFCAAITSMTSTNSIARSALNAKIGAHSSVSAVMHGVTIFLFAYCMSGVMQFIPVMVISAIMVMISYSLIDIEHNKYLLHSPKRDIFLFLLSLSLVVFYSIITAVIIGVSFSIFLYIWNKIVNKKLMKIHIKDKKLAKFFPDETEYLKMSGAFFFGSVSKLQKKINRIQISRKVIFIDMIDITSIDASGAKFLHELSQMFAKNGKRFIIYKLPKNLSKMLDEISFGNGHHSIEFTETTNF